MIAASLEPHLELLETGSQLAWANVTLAWPNGAEDEGRKVHLDDHGLRKVSSEIGRGTIIEWNRKSTISILYTVGAIALECHSSIVELI